MKIKIKILSGNINVSSNRLSSAKVGSIEVTKVKMRFNFMYCVYIIECQDGTLYTGITTDVQRRFKEHQIGKGGAYTRSKKVKKVLYTEQFKTRSEALKREFEIKNLNRRNKLNLIK